MEVYENFLGQREVLGGDNISSYIFIIRAEYLGTYIHFTVNGPKSGIGTKVAKHGLILMFAEDYIIFYKSNKIIARHVKAILENLL